MATNDSLVTSVFWIEQLLLGSIATGVAVLVVASVGLATLTGRVDVRRGALVIVGCFVLFGARPIATGLRAALAGNEPVIVAETSPAPPAVALPAQSPPAAVYDPYAGAAVPQSR